MITPLITIRKLDAGWEWAQVEIKLKALNSSEQVEVGDVRVVYREQIKEEKDKILHILYYIQLFLMFKSINQA